jgi:hypothetical protein
LREEQRPRVLRKIFGLKRDEVVGEWRRLCNEEPYDQYSSPNIIWGVGHVECVGHWSGTYRVLVRIPEGMRPRGRPWHI